MKAIKTNCTPSEFLKYAGLAFLSTLALGSQYCAAASKTGTASAADPTLKTQYQLEWSYGKLPVEVRVAQGPTRLVSRVGENGSYTESIDLPIQNRLADGTIELTKGETAVVYLFVKNNGSVPLKFSVAPHSTEPGASALGFSFNCLCNGHIYEVPAHKIWYRIMTLKNTVPFAGGRIKLKHDLFAIKG